HVGHLVRVVLVHLAAEGLDENFLGHGGSLRARQRAGWGWNADASALRARSVSAGVRSQTVCSRLVLASMTYRTLRVRPTRVCAKTRAFFSLKTRSPGARRTGSPSSSACVRVVKRSVPYSAVDGNVR